MERAEQPIRGSGLELAELLIGHVSCRALANRCHDTAGLWELSFTSEYVFESKTYLQDTLWGEQEERESS